MDIKDQIIQELAKSIKNLGGKSDLLSITGSYGDTLPDDEVLRLLREWNAQPKSIHTHCIECNNHFSRCQCEAHRLNFSKQETDGKEE